MKKITDEEITIEDVVNACKNAKNDKIEIKPSNEYNDKTLAFQLSFNFLDDDIRNEIRKLKIEDYHAGPLKDDNKNFSHPLWVFIKNIKGIKVKVYIKLKLLANKTKIIVYSFHEEGLHND